MPPKPKLQEHKLRTDFLDSFVYALISSSYKNDQPNQKQINETQQIENLPEPKEIKPLARKVLTPPPIPTAPRSINNKPEFSPSIKTEKETQIKPVAKSALQFPKYQAPAPKPGEKSKTINLGKIVPFLKDPAVIGLECPGPGKNILVNRSGSIQTSQLVLTKEEINNIMKNISEKTRIPLLSGIFKAAFQDLVITAVVSDFVGTRFMIQKRLPNQQY